MGSESVDVGSIRPIERPEATSLAATELERMVEALRELEPADWSRPTACTLWDVRAMAGHVLGMTETFTGLRRFASDMRAGTRAAGDGPMIDGLTAVQVAATAALSSDELTARLVAAGPRSVRWRTGRRLMRRIPLKQPMPDGSVETWRLAYLVDVVLTRDTWMHRSDIAAATGRPMALTPDHDGRIVADVVAEWARRHGRPFVLHLTGPAGGTFHQGEGGERFDMDAVELCRILADRGAGDRQGVLRQSVPF